MSSAEEFTSGGAGASATEPIRAGEVKKGMTVMLKDKPCRVIDLSTSKTGKHGHAKVNMVGTDIFTGKKVQDICPASHNMTKPVVSTKTYTCLDVIEDDAGPDYCSLMDVDGDTREDIKCPDMESPDPKLGEQIKEGLEAEKEVAVVVTSAMGQDAITNVKFVEDEAE